MIRIIKRYGWIFPVLFNLYALEIRQPMEHEIKVVAELYYKSWHDTFDTLSIEEIVRQRTQDNCLTLWQEYYKKGAAYFILIALEKTSIVGVLFAGPLERDDELDWGFYDSEIYKIYVDPVLKRIFPRKKSDRATGSNFFVKNVATNRINVLLAFTYKFSIVVATMKL